MNTHQLCVTVARAWAERHGCWPLAFEKPDAQNRRDPSVDLLGRDSGGIPLLVLEHTLVESFLDQRSVSIAAVEMFKPLERELSGVLPPPGHYVLTLRPSLVLGLKRETERIREWVDGWIRRTAPTLLVGSPDTAPGHTSTVLIPDTALQVSLSRWPRRHGQFSLEFEAPGDMNNALKPSFGKAVGTKCPKLASAMVNKPGAASLLLLQINDLALGNVFDLDAVIQSQLDSLTDEPPDHIWLVDTIDSPPSLMIAKEGLRSGDQMGHTRFMPLA